MLARPEAGEYAPFFEDYVARADDADVLEGLVRRLDRLSSLLRGLDEERSAHRYAPGKWSVKEVVGHLADTERVFGARCLGFARGVEGSWPGVDPDALAAAAGHARLPFGQVFESFRLARLSNLALFAEFAVGDWLRRGRADGAEMSARAVPYVLAGHQDHHEEILRERYGLR